MSEISMEDREYILNYLKYLGYGEDVLQYVKLREDDGKVVISSYPTVDHYNGVHESLLKLLIRDIEEAVMNCNRERGKNHD